MRALLAFLALAGTCLAGCSGTILGGERGRDLEALTLDWSLSDCQFGVALIETPPGVVDAYVPEGFRVLSVQEVGAIGGGAPLTPPNPGGTGNFGVELFSCAEGQGLDGPVPGMVYGSYFTAVEPPAGLRRDVTLHFVKWDTLVPDVGRRALLQSYGLPVRDGTVALEQAFAEGSASSYSGSLSFGCEERITFEGSSLLPQGDVSFVEFMATPSGGLAEWTTTVRIQAGGVGPQTVVVPEAGKAYDVLGAGTHRGLGFAGIASFTGGRLNVPAQP